MKLDAFDVLTVAGWLTIEYGLSRWSLTVAILCAGLVLLLVGLRPVWRRKG